MNQSEWYFLIDGMTNSLLFFLLSNMLPCSIFDCVLYQNVMSETVLVLHVCLSGIIFLAICIPLYVHWMQSWQNYQSVSQGLIKKTCRTDNNLVLSVQMSDNIFKNLSYSYVFGLVKCPLDWQYFTFTGHSDWQYLKSFLTWLWISTLREWPLNLITYSV